MRCHFGNVHVSLAVRPRAGVVCTDIGSERERNHGMKGRRVSGPHWLDAEWSRLTA